MNTGLGKEFQGWEETEGQLWRMICHHRVDATTGRSDNCLYFDHFLSYLNLALKRFSAAEAALEGYKNTSCLTGCG